VYTNQRGGRTGELGSRYRIHSSVVERKLSKLEVRGSKPFECTIIYMIKSILNNEWV
jgi:hypothetical protein